MKRKQQTQPYVESDRWGDDGTRGGPITKRIDPVFKRESDYRKVQQEWRETMAKLASK